MYLFHWRFVLTFNLNIVLIELHKKIWSPSSICTPNKKQPRTSTSHHDVKRLKCCIARRPRVHRDMAKWDINMRCGHTVHAECDWRNVLLMSGKLNLNRPGLRFRLGEDLHILSCEKTWCLIVRAWIVMGKLLAWPKFWSIGVRSKVREVVG